MYFIWFTENWLWIIKTSGQNHSYEWWIKQDYVLGRLTQVLKKLGNTFHARQRNWFFLWFSAQYYLVLRLITLPLGYLGRNLVPIKLRYFGLLFVESVSQSQRRTLYFQVRFKFSYLISTVLNLSGKTPEL